MESLSYEDLGMSREEIEEKKKEVQSETVKHLLDVIRAIDSVERKDMDALSVLALAGLYVIAAKRNVKTFRQGLETKLGHIADKANKKILFAMLDANKASVRLEDAICDSFNTLLTDCLGGPKTHGTQTLMKAIDEAFKQGGWLSGKDETDG